jgi:antibiotic biosynthesis monooxygenase (ABM) superfamily enzyme
MHRLENGPVYMDRGMAGQHVAPAILIPLLGPNSPQVLTAGLIAAGIVVILTWVAMPLLVKVAHRWLHA